MHTLFQPTLTASGLDRFGLSMRQAAPHRALAGVVHSYLQITACTATPYPVIPDGTQAIFMSPHGVMVGGALSRSHDVLMPEAGEYFGIRFYPAAMRRIFNWDMAELTDQFIDLHAVAGITDLHEAIYQQQSFKARVDVCQRWLLTQMRAASCTKLDHALALIHASSGTIKIKQLAAEVGCSDRHLNRLFRLHTGLGSKAFTQTVRLQQACQNIFRTPSQSLKVALDLGFTDQAHLIHEFQKRLLTSPGEFVDRFMSDFYNH